MRSGRNALLHGLLAAAVLFAQADCQRAEKVSAGSGEDQAYPADIDDLACHAVSGTGVQCSWTAVGDDQMQGRAARYWIYRHPHPITVSNVGDAILVDDTMQPAQPGTTESTGIDGLAEKTTYWFAVKVADDAGNWVLSNSDDATTLDASAPPPVSGFQATPTGGGLPPGIDLSWTNPQVDDFDRVLILRREDAPPSTPDDTGALQVYTGDGESHRDADIADETGYHYRAWTFDTTGNHSAPADTFARRSSSDDDGDGYGESDGDCDDTDDRIHPGAQAQGCSGIDWDCDGEGWEDRACAHLDGVLPADCVEAAPSCDPGIGCNLHPVPDGTACDDENPDTLGEACWSGACTTGLPDTGQVACYDDAAQLATCPGDPQEDTCARTAWCGQDAQYGRDAAAPPFERFEITGTPPEEVVFDRITGLRWQRIQDWDAHYHEHWQEASDYCAALLYAGDDDWRLPGVRELASLLDFDHAGPAIDPDTFPDTPCYFFWSATTTDDGATFWRVEFERAVTGTDVPDWWGYARCVRGASWPPKGTYLVLGPAEELVLDTRTGLMWQRDHSSPMDPLDWGAELSRCQELELGGFSDWRLPSITELWSIVEIGATEPSIDTRAFPGTQSMFFRSSTTYRYDDMTSWVVAVPFNEGIIAYFSKTDAYGSVMRCVRGGPPHPG